MPLPLEKAKPWIAPSLIAASPLRLEEVIAAVEESGAELLHLDVMDGNFVPNITLGPWIIRAIRERTRLPLDVHLMITNPEALLPAFIECRAEMISVHYEAALHLPRLLATLKDKGICAGVAINPATPVEHLKVILPVLDFVVVMSVNPGFAGQEFLPFVLPKIEQLRSLRENHGYSFWIEVDGGIHAGNAGELRERGADILVAGQGFFSSGDLREAYEKLKGMR